jgi:tRNA-2-methylthio-N6-dimethylallyladenosine synthase
VRALAADGVLEVTLLGQNVNAYGVEFGDRARSRSCCAPAVPSTGWSASVHLAAPADFTSDVIAAMAETPNVCPQLHMPLQSGSDDVLRRMRRSYRSARFLGILDEVRPRAARRDHHRHHRRLPRRDRGRLRRDARRGARRPASRARSPSSTPRAPARRPRPARPAAEEAWSGALPAAGRVQEEISWAANRALEGRVVEVLVAAGEGRKDAATRRLSGRARDGRLVHFAPGDAAVRPGDVVEVAVGYGAPHHLVADGSLLSHRRTRAGDLHETGTRPGGTPTGLGLPGFGTPPPVAAVGGCSTREAG